MHTQCIWQAGVHNAFTDLIAWQGALWCVFREGSAHVSADGAFRLLRSGEQGQQWQSVALITHPAADLRDAKFSILPDGRLMLYGAGALHDRQQQSHQSFAWYSDNGLDWSPAQAIGEANIWIWRLSWRQQTALALGYKCGTPRFVRAYQSRDGYDFQAISPAIYSGSYANESALHFEPDGTALCLLRRDPEHGLYGRASPPYTEWHWQDSGMRIGGPAWLALPNGRLLACVRLYDNQVRTSLCWVDKHTGKLNEWRTLPSGGDCSYAGMVVCANQLIVSYYSSHEGQSRIYIARLLLQEVAETSHPS